MNYSLRLPVKAQRWTRVSVDPVSVQEVSGTQEGEQAGTGELSCSFSQKGKHAPCIPQVWPGLHLIFPLEAIFTCLLRNLYAGQKATVRARHGTMDWFQIRKKLRQGCMLSPCLFNLHAEYIMRNAEQDEVQAGIKIARRNINNLKYADDTTLMAESEEDLKSLLMKVKEESENTGLSSTFRKLRSQHLVPSLHGK